MAQVKLITRTLYIHRKPGRDEDIVEICDLTKNMEGETQDWAVEPIGECIGSVEAVITYTDIEGESSR